MNHRHKDFQSSALPTELLGQGSDYSKARGWPGPPQRATAQCTMAPKQIPSPHPTSDASRNMAGARHSTTYSRTADPASGFRQRSSANRSKSPSVEQSSSPCSMASAARCASGSRFACTSGAHRSDSSTSRCRSGRLGNPDHVCFKPGPNLAPRVGDGFGTLEYARVRDNSQKGQKAGPTTNYGRAHL